MHEVLLSVAPVSGTPHLIDPAAIAEDVCACYEAGAAMVHLHVRDENGALTPDLSLLAETVRRIREQCDIVIEISTGGVSNLSIEERCAPCTPDWVEANSLNVGSVNLGDAVYCNPIQDVRYCVDQILKNRKVPEIEVFELGMIHTVSELMKEYDFPKPVLFALVFGHPGEMPATPAALRHMLDFLAETFTPEALPKKEILWGYTQAHREDWEMMRHALSLGADSLRVGFEDSDILAPGVRTDRNAPIVQKAAQLIREAGADVMTSTRAREILGIRAGQRGVN
ncbi:MAG: 3-keto-5-aminohexanoate cleavage protein [Lachnospiraceae bacterium]|nr:3-keto-5-aminohexanoate cleavage protein [Lachnospiraceae bacterium]